MVAGPSYCRAFCAWPAQSCVNSRVNSLAVDWFAASTCCGVTEATVLTAGWVPIATNIHFTSWSLSSLFVELTRHFERSSAYGPAQAAADTPVSNTDMSRADLSLTLAPWMYESRIDGGKDSVLVRAVSEHGYPELGLV